MRMFLTGGAALLAILSLGSAAHAQYPYRGNPYANSVYQYQMAVAQQRAYYLAAQQRQQLTFLAAQQRVLALQQQARWHALPLQTKRQVVAAAQFQQQQLAALELQRLRARQACQPGQKRDILDGPKNALEAILYPFVFPIALLGALLGK